jgi:two-component system, OmpR family, phosphate regulon response regulator PhoB
MPSEPAAPKFILMIEDNCDHAEAVTRLLELNGFRSECVSSGEHALKRIEEVSPDLIRLDFTLPGMSGADVGKALRSASDTADVPIVMGSGMPEWVIRESFADFDGFLAKPFDPEDLLTVVAKLTDQAA